MHMEGETEYLLERCGVLLPANPSRTMDRVNICGARRVGKPATVSHAVDTIRGVNCNILSTSIDTRLAIGRRRAGDDTA